MRKSVKLISALLALIMVFSLLPISVLAAEPTPAPESTTEGQITAIAGALSEVLKYKVGETVGKVGEIGETGKAIGGFFGSVVRFLSAIGVRQEDYIGLFVSEQWKDISILIQKTETENVFDAYIQHGEQTIRGTGKIDGNAVVLKFVVEDGIYVIGTITKDENAYSLTVTDFAPKTGYWGSALVVDEPYAIKKAEEQPVDVKEAGKSFYGIVSTAARITQTVYGFVEELGVKGKLFGFIKDFVFFDDALQKWSKGDQPEPAKAFDFTGMYKDEGSNVLTFASNSAATFTFQTGNTMDFTVKVTGNVAELTNGGTSATFTATPGEEGVIVFTLGNFKGTEFWGTTCETAEPVVYNLFVAEVN